MEELEKLWHTRTTDKDKKAEADNRRGEIFHYLRTEKNVSYLSQTVNVKRFVRWLAAAGEFRFEAERFQIMIESMDENELITIAGSLADWSIQEVFPHLKPYTKQVKTFLNWAHDQNEREDIFLITRSETEYHCNMLGAEVMNRGFRSGFVQTKKRIVLVPGCMRVFNDSRCKADVNGLDIICTFCSSHCNVAAITRLGLIKNFSVLIVPHASNFSAWLKPWQGVQDTGLVAVACPLHLVPGGLEMRKLGLMAQCIELNFSGCKKHWNPEGIATSLDTKRLLSLL
ncbi:hypothetical protein CHISP_1834 [Chitinispirillum alkaliphilum]|nr:hypothetical protein CHISP_1834 [Chitinispirillum alkaliphilum]